MLEIGWKSFANRCRPCFEVVKYISTPSVIVRSHREIFRRCWNFWKFKVALNLLRIIFLNFAKSCILSCWLHFDNKKWGSPSWFLSYKRLKLKLRVFLAGHNVAMVTYCATKLTATLLYWLEIGLWLEVDLGWLV